MAVTISAVVLLGAITFFLLKSKSVGAGGALVLFFFGFFVAGTGAAGPITDITTSIAQTIADLRT
ncbi:hypothetical protein [Streptomyces sp. H27-C3]|uniref:hypothetical protein n=1 Tax=Streptomyces sp. H27-C3 TaxID=3046305 RepID=UPI0024B8991D|nr:hypothetical protein [Streptomyces sp. H27-C3]MDJ0461505.1 hypothetical protein [Streptomyces sp. H27-C3]